MTKGKTGKLYKKYEKTWFFECDLNPRGGGKLSQPRLSFAKMTPDDRKSGGRGGANDNSVMGGGSSTCTVGQTEGCAVELEGRRAGIND